MTRRISEHTNVVHDRGINNDKSFSPDVLLHPDPLHTSLPKKQNNPFPTSQDTSINLESGENSPFQESIISETIQRLNKMFFQNPKRLKDIIRMGNLIHKFLPKQMDIDKILHVIQKKMLKGTHLPVGYLHCPYFKEIYQYL